MAYLDSDLALDYLPPPSGPLTFRDLGHGEWEVRDTKGGDRRGYIVIRARGPQFEPGMDGDVYTIIDLHYLLLFMQGLKARTK